MRPALLGRRCAATYPMAQALLQFGLPLRMEVKPLLQGLPQTCDLCVYARVHDGREASHKTRAKLLTSLERRLQRLAPNGPTCAKRSELHKPRFSFLHS